MLAKTITVCLQIRFTDTPNVSSQPRLQVAGAERALPRSVTAVGVGCTVLLGILGAEEEGGRKLHLYADHMKVRGANILERVGQKSGRPESLGRNWRAARYGSAIEGNLAVAISANECAPALDVERRGPAMRVDGSSSAKAGIRSVQNAHGFILEQKRVMLRCCDQGIKIGTPRVTLGG